MHVYTVMDKRERIDGVTVGADGGKRYQLRWLAKWNQQVRDDDPPTCRHCGAKTKWAESFTEVVVNKGEVTLQLEYTCTCPEGGSQFVISPLEW